MKNPKRLELMEPRTIVKVLINACLIHQGWDDQGSHFIMRPLSKSDPSVWLIHHVDGTELCAVLVIREDGAKARFTVASKGRIICSNKSFLTAMAALTTIFTVHLNSKKTT